MAVKTKGITIPIGVDTKEFDKGLRKMDSSIKSTEKYVDSLEKSLEVDFDPSKLVEAQKKAQEAISKSETKVKALKEQIKTLEDSDAEIDPKTFDKLNTELIKSEMQLTKLQEKFENLNNMKLESLANKFKDLGDTISNVGNKLVPISAIAAGATAGLLAVGKSVPGVAGEIEDLGKQVNMTAEQIQKWQYVSSMAGVESSALQNGLIKIQSAFGDLAAGSVSNATKALEKLGFVAADAEDGMSVNFDAMVEKLTAVEDSMVQASIANDIFGERMGAKLIPILKEGGAGLQKFKDEFDSLGALTNEQVEELAKLDDAFQKNAAAVTNIKNQLAVGLMPVMEVISNFIESKVVPAFQKATEWFNSLSDGAKKTIVASLALVAALAPVLIIAGKLIGAVGAVISSIKLLNIAMAVLAANPIILIITGVVAALAALYTLNEDFRKSINKLVSTIGSALTPILDLIINLIGSLFTALKPFINLLGGVLTPIVEVLSTMLDGVATVIDMILRPVSSLVNKFTSMFSVLKPLVNFMEGMLIPVFNKVAEVVEFVMKGIESFVNGVLQLVEKVVNGVIDFVNLLIRQVNKLGEKIGFTIDELENVKLKLETKTTIEKVDATNSATTAAANNNVGNYSSSVTNYNNDNSTKNIQLNVTVENYAENVDWDKAIEQLQIRLANEF